MMQSLCFIEKYKKEKKREAPWGILLGWNNISEVFLVLDFIVKFPDIFEKN